MALNVGTLFAALKLQDKGFDKQVQGKGNMMKSVIGAGATAAAAAGVAAFAAIGAGTAVALKTGITYNAQLETMNTAWKTLTGSTEGATKMVQDLGKFAAKTPFSQMGLDSMAKYLYNADFKGQDLFDTLTKFGDIGGAFGLQEDSIQEMVRQFGQMKNAGVAYTEDLNVFENRGIPIMKELAKAHGVTTADIKKMAGEGKISYEMVQGAVDNMAGNMKGSMEAQSKTFSGLMSTMKDNLQMLAADLSKPMFDKMKQGLEFMLNNLDKVQPVVDAIRSAFESFAAAAANFLTPIAEQVKIFLQSFAGASSAGSAFDGLKAAVATMQPVFQMVFPFIKGIVQDAVTFIGGLLGQLTAFWQQNGQQIMAATKTVWGILSTIIQAALVVLLPIVSGIWNNIKGVIQGAMNIILGIIKTVSSLLTGDWRGAWEGIKQILSGAVQFIWNAIQLYFVGRIIGAVRGFVVGFRTILSTGFSAARTAVVNVITAMRTSVTGGFTAIRSYIGMVINTIRGVISTGFNAYRSVVSSVIATIRSVITTGFNAYRSVISSVINAIRSVISSGFNAARSIVASVIGAIRSTITAGFNAARSIVASVMNAIRSVIASGFNAARSVAASAINAIRSVAASGFNAVRSVVSSVMNGIRSAIASGFNAARSAAASAVNGIRSAVSSAFNSLRSVVSSAMSGVVGAIRNGWNGALAFLRGINLSTIGRQIVQGLVNGIGSAAGAIGRKVSELTSGIPATIKKIMGIASPSKVTTKLGEWIGEGLTNGISKSGKKAAEAAAKAAAKVKKEMERKQAEIKRNQEREKKQAYSFQQSLDKINEKQVAKVKSVASKLADTEKKLTAEYTKARKERAQEIAGANDLFNFVEQKHFNPKQFTNALQSQNEAIRIYSKSIENLKKRGVSGGLLAELEGKGVGSAFEIKALSELSDYQLRVYRNLYNERQKLANQQTTREMADERKRLAVQIENERKKARALAASYRTEWVKEIQDLKKKTVVQVGSISTGMRAAGKEAINGMIQGMKSMTGGVKSAAAQLAQSIAKTIKKELQIKSPSRLMRDQVGKFIPAGIALGINNAARVAINSARALAANVTSEASKYDVTGTNTDGYSTIGTTGRSAGGNVYNHTTVINAPRESNSREVAKLDRRASKNLARELGLI